jgi:hypothetical protein
MVNIDLLSDEEILSNETLDGLVVKFALQDRDALEKKITAMMDILRYDRVNAIGFLLAVRDEAVRKA